MSLGNETSVVDITSSDLDGPRRNVVRFVAEGADLSHKTFQNVTFLGGVSLKRVNLRHTKLITCIFANIELKNGVDFSHTVWDDIEFRTSSRCEFMHLQNGTFTDSIICGNRDEFLHLLRTQSREAKFDGCDFRWVVLDDSDFARTEFTWCQFQNTELNGVDMRQAELSGVTFNGATQGQRLNLWQATLLSTQFIGGSAETLTNYRNIAAQGTEMMNLRMEKLDLTGGSFDGAIFSGKCVIEGCRLTDCSFNDIVVDDEHPENKLEFRNCTKDGEPYNETILPETLQPDERPEPPTQEIIFESVEELDGDERLFEENSDYVLEEITDSE